VNQRAHSSIINAVAFRRLNAGLAIVAIGLWSGFVLAGGAPGTQPLQGGSIPATNTQNNTGSPFNGTSGGLQTSSSSAGSQAVPGANAGGSVPGGNYYGGSSDTATSAVRERGVAGSGLPREKVIEVNDAKSLPSTKSDGKFSSSLLGSDFKSAKDIKPTAQKETDAKSQAHIEKPEPSSAKTAQENKAAPASSPADSKKAGEKR